MISIVGDIMLDRGVAEAVSSNGVFYPYEGIAQLFHKDDITIANLECPLTLADDNTMKEKQFVFKADPDNANALKLAGFDALMLANNHTMDYLSEGLSNTMKALDYAGIYHAGAGQGTEDIKPCFIKKNGICIGILSYSSFPVEDFTHSSNKGGDEATIAYAYVGLLGDMQKDIEWASAQCDFLIVYFHWGIEYRHDVSDSQIEIAHTAIDSGASAVVGTHPHVLQGREIYNGVPIYYSIGNFVFDKQIPEGTDEALILQLAVGKNGIVTIQEIPVIIEDCRPRLADEEEAVKIEADMKRYSRRFEL